MVSYYLPAEEAFFYFIMMQSSKVFFHLNEQACCVGRKSVVQKGLNNFMHRTALTVLTDLTPEGAVQISAQSAAEVKSVMQERK